MHIAIDIRCLMTAERTGVGEYTFQLLTHIFAIDNINQYYLFYNSSHDVSANLPKFNRPNVQLVGFKYPNRPFNALIQLFGFPKLNKLIEKTTKQPIDFFFFPNNNFLAVSCPYIITCHDLSFELFPKFLTWKRRLWHWLINPKSQYLEASHIVAVSNNTHDDLVRIYGIKKEKIVMIYSGMEECKIKDQRPKITEPFILYISTIEPRKNVETIIKAFELFSQNHQEYHLVIAGPRGWKCAETFRRISLNKMIEYRNFITEKEKKSIYREAAMFVFPSYYEGFGFPPLEAMAAGCPVITAPNSSLTEICEKAALYANPLSVSDLAEAMSEATDPTIAERLITLGYEQVKKFSWTATAKQYLTLFNSQNKKHPDAWGPDVGVERE